MRFSFSIVTSGASLTDRLIEATDFTQDIQEKKSTRKRLRSPSP
jgi:hypothetical protein